MTLRYQNPNLNRNAAAPVGTKQKKITDYNGKVGSAKPMLRNAMKSVPMDVDPILKKSIKRKHTEQENIFQQKLTMPSRFTSRPSDVEDIYEDFAEMEEEIVPYVNQIFDYMHDIEYKYVMDTSFLKTSPVTPRMRCILIDWLISVHYKFRMQVDTLYLACDLLDRFLSLPDVKTNKDDLQLLGVTCLFTASKFEEIYPPDLTDFIYMTDGACEQDDVLVTEMVLLKKLGFSLHAPLACKFLRRLSKAKSHNADLRDDTAIYGIAKYFLEATLLSSHMSFYSASEKAIGAQFASSYLNEMYKVALTSDDNVQVSSIWDSKMQYYSSYDLTSAIKMACIVLNIHVHFTKLIDEGSKHRYTALLRKYSSEPFYRVAKSECLSLVYCETALNSLLVILKERLRNERMVKELSILSAQKNADIAKEINHFIDYVKTLQPLDKPKDLILTRNKHERKNAKKADKHRIKVYTHEYVTLKGKDVSDLKKKFLGRYDLPISSGSPKIMKQSQRMRAANYLLKSKMVHDKPKPGVRTRSSRLNVRRS